MKDFGTLMLGMFGEEKGRKKIRLFFHGQGIDVEAKCLEKLKSLENSVQRKLRDFWQSCSSPVQNLCLCTKYYGFSESSTSGCWSISCTHSFIQCLLETWSFQACAAESD